MDLTDNKTTTFNNKMEVNTFNKEISLIFSKDSREETKGIDSKVVVGTSITTRTTTLTLTVLIGTIKGTTTTAATARVIRTIDNSTRELITSLI